MAAAAASREPGSDPNAPPAGAAKDRSTHFIFQHRVFNLPGACFRLTTDTAQPALFVTLGDLSAALLVPSLAGEFGIGADTPDGKLLAIIERSLKFVKEIRPNDSIPREILDGSASWSVDEAHRERVRQRLVVQLASWHANNESVVTDADELAQLAEDPKTKERALSAYEQLAEKLGLGADQSRQVVDRVEALGRELVYIESLRDRCMVLKQAAEKIGRTASVLRSDRTMTEIVVRVQALLQAPVAAFFTLLDEVDAQTGEILPVLRNFETMCRYIRDHRDELHQRLLDWDELLERWNGQAVERSDAMERLLRDTYRFLAQRVEVGQRWQSRA